MNKITLLFLLCLTALLSACANKAGKCLFDGTNTDDWQISGNVTVNPADSVLTLSGSDSKAFFKKGSYKDFDLKLRVRTTGNGKGFIGFHTDDTGKGYHIAIHNDNNDPVWWRKTGSLKSVRNLTKSMVKEGEWFDMNIRVEGRLITVKVNGQTVVEYIEPAVPFRSASNERALLSKGTVALISSGEGNLEFKNICIETLSEKDIDTGAQLQKAGDEQNDAILKLHQDDFPVLDYHVHLKGGFTKEAAAVQSRQLGINYAIAPNCGIGFPITDDAGVYQFLNSMRSQPFILAMQGEGREWVTTFSKEARDEFDFVFTDALTFTDHKGRRVRLWVNEDVIIDDEQQYMDLIVDRTCEVLREPADVFVNPFFLPDRMKDRYDEFWTEKRMTKVIDALAKSGMALEINELYNIPNKALIMKAKEAGVKFTFGSNNVSPEVGRLEYSVKMKQECGITQQDMFKPDIKL